MEKLALSWFDVETVPQNYIFPSELRPGKQNSYLSKSIPVVDLQRGNKAHIIQQIVEAGTNFGIFQVINHGVAKEVSDDVIRVLKDFFSMPTEDKTEVNERGLVYTSNTGYAKDGINLWRENLKHFCSPLENRMKLCPEKPAGFRQVLETYLTKVNKLSMDILELVSEGLGIERDFFTDLSELQLLASNHYPPCPDPSVTLGILKHCDPSIISILLQDVVGLQVLKDEQWIDVEALPNAFVVIMGSQMQTISSGKLKSAEHRVITNSSSTRTSITTFINPKLESMVEPAKLCFEKATASNPSEYNAYVYKDFVSSREAFGPDTDQILKATKTEATMLERNIPEQLILY